MHGRWWFAWIVVVGVGSGACDHAAGPRATPPRAAGAPLKQSAAPQRTVVSVGMRLDDVHRVLLANGASDISDRVQIKPQAPATMRWYELPDGTCLQARAHPDASVGADVVTTLTLGEPGRGYGDKIVWSEQRHQQLTELDVRQP